MPGYNSQYYSQNIPKRPSTDFFDYWEALGFFENLQVILPPKFFIIFEIARVIFTPDFISEALSAVEDMSKEEVIVTPNRDETILFNRAERVSPLSDNMMIDNYRTIYDMKKALPRELAWEDSVFDIKLFNKTLLVQRFYESQEDKFRPVTTSRDERGRDANRFDQKFYLLLDRSRSMDFKMRSFFSKCLVAEFFRRKLNSNAKIFYRSFDSKTGDLIKIKSKEDFPHLIEQVLMTTTGGTGTNLQNAVYQAIEDIRYDKELINAEILVVTDGISSIEKYEMKQKLGDIKLNVLKIGDDLAEPNYFELKKTLDHSKISFDPSTRNMREIKQKLNKAGEKGEQALSPTERRAYRFMLDYSEKMFNDLKEVSHRFVEICDLEPGELFKLTDDMLDNLETAVDEFGRIDLDSKSQRELERIYKQAFFLGQYIELLMDYGGNSKNPILQKSAKDLNRAKQKMLQNPGIYELINSMKDIKENKQAMKLAGKDVRKKIKEMHLTNRHITAQEMKIAKLMITMDAAEGSSAQLLKLLFVKLWVLVSSFIKMLAGRSKTSKSD